MVTLYDKLGDKITFLLIGFILGVVYISVAIGRVIWKLLRKNQIKKLPDIIEY